MKRTLRGTRRRRRKTRKGGGGSQVDICTTKQTWDTLIGAISAGNIDLVNQIVTHCPSIVYAVDVYPPQYSGMTPLYWAVCRNMQNIPLDAQYFAGKPAPKDNYYRIAELLLDRGAEPNKRTTQWYPGWAPIHWAAEYGNVDMINLLKQRGADYTFTYYQMDGSVTSLRDIATHATNGAAAKAILDVIASPNIYAPQ